MEENVKKVLSRMESLCARSEHCSKDIHMKALKAVGGDVAAADEIVGSLLEDGYVDDRRYASAFAREKSSLTGWGPIKIRLALSAKGIPGDVISEALKDRDEEASARKLEAMVRLKYKSVAEEKDCKLRLLRFALGRGYGYDEAASVVDMVISEGRKA